MEHANKETIRRKHSYLTCAQSNKQTELKEHNMKLPTWKVAKLAKSSAVGNETQFMSQSKFLEREHFWVVPVIRIIIMRPEISV